MQDTIIMIVIIAGGVLAYLKYGNKSGAKKIVIDEVLTLLAKWELPTEIIELIQKLASGDSSKEVQAKANQVCADLRDSETALSKLSKTWDYQLAKKLDNFDEVKKLKARVIEAEQAHLAKSQQTVKDIQG